jgi:hypothetical protein
MEQEFIIGFEPNIEDSRLGVKTKEMRQNTCGVQVSAN